MTYLTLLLTCDNALKSQATYSAGRMDLQISSEDHHHFI